MKKIEQIKGLDINWGGVSMSLLKKYSAPIKPLNDQTTQE